MRKYEVTPDDMKLIDEAYKALEKARVPGNFFHTVGCCLKAKDGTLYHGVNCDCIHGSCAEFIAVGNAKVNGCHEFDTIVLSGQFQQCMAKHILILLWFIGIIVNESLSSVRIELSWSVPSRHIFLCRRIAMSLLSVKV